MVSHDDGESFGAAIDPAMGDQTTDPIVRSAADGSFFLANWDTAMTTAGTLARSLSAVRHGGTISLMGVLATGDGFSHLPIVMKAVRLQGILVGSRAMFEAMNKAIALHQLRPVVGRVFPFAEALEALRYMESGAHVGKIVISFER